jgi:hypothetical protein
MHEVSVSFRSVRCGLVPRVSSANVRGKLLVALRLKVPRHCIESLADRRISSVEDPPTLGAAPTTKARLVYPHQVARHGRIIYSKTSVINIDHSRFRLGPNLPATV